MMKISVKNALFCSFFTLMISQALSHSAWLDERVGEPTIIYGHGSSDDAYNPGKVSFVKGYDKDGNVKVIEKKDGEKNVSLVIPEEIMYIGFILDNGYWSKNGDGKWENKPKTEVKGATEGGHYIKNAIAVVSEDATVKSVEGLALQVLPLENPLTKKAGDKLTIQVLFNGKPLADTQITGDYINMSHESETKTDKDGKATVSIRNQGLNVISASHTEELEADPKADQNGYTATLSFELEHLDED